MSAPPVVYKTSVASDWVDYNGHMRDAYYGLVFSYAIDALMIDLGMDEDYRTRVKGTLYVVELHQYFLKEAHEAAPLKVAARLLDADQKRLHVCFELLHGESGECLAVQETLQLHVVQDGAPRSAAFGDDVQARVDALLREHSHLPEPDNVSRAIAIRRR